VTATLSHLLPAERRVGHRRRRVPAHPPRPPVRCDRLPEAENTRPRPKPAWTPFQPTHEASFPCHAWVSDRARLRSCRSAGLYVNGNPLNYNDPDGHHLQCIAPCSPGEQKSVNQQYAAGPGTETNQQAASQAEATGEAQYQAVVQLVATAQGFVGSDPYAQYPGEYSRTTGLWQPPTDAQALQLLGQGLAAQAACLAAGGLADCEAGHDPLTQYELSKAHVDLGGLLRGLIPGVGCYRAAGNASAGNIASCALGVLPLAGAAVKVVGAGLDVGADDAAALAAGRSQLAAGLRDLLANTAGFTGQGEKLIIDNSVPINPQSVAQALIANGYDARTVGQIFGPDPGDPAILQLAQQLNARVVASDVGHDIGGGFGSQVVQIPGQIQQIQSIIRLLNAS
jgi:hypothetical protein